MRRLRNWSDDWKTFETVICKDPKGDFTVQEEPRRELRYMEQKRDLAASNLEKQQKRARRRSREH